jgi:transposase
MHPRHAFAGAAGTDHQPAQHTDLAPLDAMLCYKQLTMVEQTFRTAKSLFATRPIFHKVDETIRGHVSCSFLALARRSNASAIEG